MSKILLSSLKKEDEFIRLYSKLVLGQELAEEELVKILEIAILFLNSSKPDIYHFGYRILILYHEVTKDFYPLYDASLLMGYYPISKYIEETLITGERSGFWNQLQHAFLKNYKDGKKTLTFEQNTVRSRFFDPESHSSFAVIAPTSYGKSEMMIASLREDKNLCIIVPTKSLIAQTKRRVLESEEIDSDRKIVTHHEMYEAGDESIIAILTQERFVRLMNKNPMLEFNVVYVDEAHNLLEKGERSKLLAMALIIAKKRNPHLRIYYFTPFLKHKENLEIQCVGDKIEELRIGEQLKSERIYFCDFKKGNSLYLYDQYLDRAFLKDQCEVLSLQEAKFILNHGSSKNIVYLNRPFDVDRFTNDFIGLLSEVNDIELNEVCDDIKAFLHEEYTLLKCIKKGVVYHHGSMPDNVRLFVEHLYSTNKNIKYIITTSTLLEGVNIPGERLFLLSNKKGGKNLSPYQFRNLIGRVCRFSEIFNPAAGSLLFLSPRIYVVGGKYTSKVANIETFVKTVARVDKKIIEVPGNILLAQTKTTEKNKVEKEHALNIVDNLERGATQRADSVIVKTVVGKLCIDNNIYEFDVFSKEQEIQDMVDELVESKIILSDPLDLLNYIAEIFIRHIDDINKNRNILRLLKQNTRNFYSYFLSLRLKGALFPMLINGLLTHWKTVEETNDIPFVYVGNWGEDTIDGDKIGSKNWVNVKKKTYSQRVNLAIVRAKEEQDFFENNILKFIEVIHSLGLLDHTFYLRVKYGTSDEKKIAFLRSGLSPALANLVVSKYQDYILMAKGGDIKLKKDIINSMKTNKENHLMVFEARYSVRK